MKTRTGWAVALMGAMALPAWADKKVDEAVAKAREQRQKGRDDEAEKTLRKLADQQPTSPEAHANHDAMATLVADLRDRQAAVAGRGAGGDDRSIARHRERGKLPVR